MSPMRVPKLARIGLRSFGLLITVLTLLLGGQTPVYAANVNVRVVNASPDAGPIDLYEGATRIAAGINFRAFSPPVSLPEGPHLFRAFPANADPNATPPIVQFTVDLPPGFGYVLGIINRRPGIQPIAVVDAPAAPSNYFNFRVVNLSPDTPSIDLFRVINTSTQRPIIQDVAFGNAKTVRLRSGTYTFQLRRFGTNEVLLELPAQRFASRAHPTLWVFNAVAGARKFAAAELNNNEQFVITSD